MSDIETKLTAAVREADQAFEKEGGSSRHYVRECLLPTLESAQLLVVDASSFLFTEKEVQVLRVLLDESARHEREDVMGLILKKTGARILNDKEVVALAHKIESVELRSIR